MDSPAIKCPECQSEDIENDNFVNVCTNCGTVVKDTPEAPGKNNAWGDLNDYTRSSVRVSQIDAKNQGAIERVCRDYTKTLTPRLSALAKHCIDVIDNVCKSLNLPKSIYQMSVNVFKEVTSKQPFKKESSNAKLCLALSCLYLVSNREDNPITLTELWKNTDCVFDHFGTMFLRLEKHFPDIYPNKSKNIESLVPFYLFKVRLDDKEKPVIADYATNLVWMWRQAVLVQGFNPIAVIYAALFFAWKAVDLERSKVYCTQFCTLVGIEFTPIIRKRISFYTKVLLDFYRLNPLHLDETISPSMLPSKIKEIVQMKRIILWNYNNAEKSKYEETDEVDLHEEIAKRMTSETDPLEDEDFSDSEIDSYIRTNTEIKSITELQSN